MSKISFYQVMNGEIVKYACQLLEKCYASKMNTFVQIGDEETLETLNKTLWTFAQKSFIPHGSMNDPIPEKQPIYLSVNDECPIEAEILMLLYKEKLDIKNFKRVLNIIDGLDREKVNEAKKFALKLLGLGHEVDYYIQNNKGLWEKTDIN